MRRSSGIHLLSWLLLGLSLFGLGGCAGSGGDDDEAEPTVSVLTIMEAQAGKEYAVKNALLAVAAASRQEPGCVGYDLYQGNDATIYGSWGRPTAPTAKFVEVQTFKNQDALDAHVAAPYVQAFTAQAGDFLVTPEDETSPIYVTTRIGKEGPHETERGMLSYVGLLKATAGNEDTVRTKLLELVDQTRAQEPGILRYDLYQGAFFTDPSRLVILQEYKDSLALDQHITADYFQTFYNEVVQTPMNGGNEGFFVDLITEPARAPIPALPDTVTVVATSMQAKPGMELAARLELEALCAESRREPGCLGYDLFQGNDATTASSGDATTSTGLFVLHEVWKDGAAIGFHMGTRHFNNFWAKANYYFETPAGASGPFNVTIALVPADENAGVTGIQRVLRVTASAGFAGEKDNLLSLIETARTSSTIKGYEIYQGGPQFGSSADSIIVWERFQQPTDGSPAFDAVEDFMNSATGQALAASYGLAFDASTVRVDYLDEIACPPGVYASRRAVESFAPVEPPATFPGF